MMAQILDPIHLLEQKEVYQAVDTVLETLTPRESDVIKRRFGFDSAKQTRSEIGGLYNISAESVLQIEKRALRKLRHPKRTALIVAAGYER